MSDQALSERVRQALRAAGAARSSELQEVCAASQASISRALGPLLAAGEVLKTGRGRAQAYVMPRTVEGVGAATVPVTRIDAAGELSVFGSLVPVAGGRYWMEEAEGGAALHDGLPWFIADMRPQGFLGRAFAHAQPGLRLAQNPEHWSDDDVLKALCQAGDDLPGNLIVGASALDRYLQSPPPARVAAAEYPELAEAAMRGALPGSSAGGEQPKFCAMRADGQPVLVKFSAAGDAPADERWRDLLHCEHLALRTLAQAGIPAAKSAFSVARGRAFLEVERFDRTPQGRIAMVSLLAYDAHFIGQMDNWAAAAGRMAARNLLGDEDADRLRLLEAFGLLIGNTDRHYGNISLLLDRSSWRLAPAYDMLPMVYAPVGGELVARDFDAGALAPTADTLAVWKPARELAQRYWQAVAVDKGVSAGFRKLAAQHAAQLQGPHRVARPAAPQIAFQRTRPS